MKLSAVAASSYYNLMQQLQRPLNVINEVPFQGCLLPSLSDVATTESMPDRGNLLDALTRKSPLIITTCVIQMGKGGSAPEEQVDFN
jgi:hypothetical protein